MFPIIVPFPQKKRDEQDSMVQMSAAEVQSLAERSLARFKEIKAAEAEKHITATMNRWNGRWYNRLFKKTYTYEEVAKMEDPVHFPGFAIFDSRLHWIDCLFYDEEKVVKRLLRVAGLGKDVWVCSKDLALLIRYGETT